MHTQHSTQAVRPKRILLGMAILLPAVSAQLPAADTVAFSGGGKLYEQRKPTIDLVTDFVAADHFSRPDVWCRAEMTSRAPDHARVAVRLGGWDRVQVDGVSLVHVVE